MIFGFNSEVRLQDTTYHVQSELRSGEHLFQTQVFVQGRCIGKRAVSFTDRLNSPAFDEEAMQEALRDQHRWAVDTIRDGYLEEFMREYGENSPSADHTTLVAEGNTLQLRFLSSSRPMPDQIVLRFQTFRAGEPFGGVALLARLLPESSLHATFTGGAVATALSHPDGNAELTLPVDPRAYGEAILLVQATQENDRIVKKFRLRANS